MDTYDLVVIGSGPGGYVCAIRAAQNGLKTALVEKYSCFGGTCLNVGCIPSKSLLHSSELYEKANRDFANYGIELEGIRLNWEKMQAAKNKVVAGGDQGIQFLCKKNKVTTLEGEASFVDKNEIQVESVAGKKTILKTKNTVIATGSKPIELAQIKLDKKRIISSTEALSLSEVPTEMLVVGGGVIGCELASIYARLGSKVSIIEYADSILSTMDKELGKILQTSLKKLGIEIFLNQSVADVEIKENSIILKSKDTSMNWEANYCLLSVGRKAYTVGLNLEKIGIETTAQGSIPVNSHFQVSLGQTSVPNIYAIGDVIGGVMLAHKAEEEGIFVADYLSKKTPHINYKTIPSVVYTSPEVASVGFSEEELNQKSMPYKKGDFAFKNLGKANAAGETEGMVKVLADIKTDEILGVHIVGARASDLIAEAVIAMEYKASAEDVAMINHAHPTFSEAIKEACMDAFNNKPIHK